MPDSDHPDFYKVLFNDVRSGLRRVGIPGRAVGLLELKRAAESLKGLSLEWDDPENYDGNVEYLVRYFQRQAQRIQPSALHLIPPPRQETLNPRHGVAYVTVQDPPLRDRVRRLRQQLWGTAEPMFPWLDLGLAPARQRSYEWLLDQEQAGGTELQEARMEILVVTSTYRALEEHVDGVATAYASDAAWLSQGRPLTPDLGQALLAVPTPSLHAVVAESGLEFPGDEPLTLLAIKVRKMGKTLLLPSYDPVFRIFVPDTGILHELREALVDIALLTSWWDTSPALEYVFTGHPTLPPPFPVKVDVPEGRKRRPKVLTLKHVALLQLVHQLPESGWKERLEVFNSWCRTVPGLRPFPAGSEVQAMRVEHVRATRRARLFGEQLPPTEARLSLLADADRRR